MKTVAEATTRFQMAPGNKTVGSRPFQAVHMLADDDFIGPWKEGAPRQSRIVFIGRNVDRPELQRGFEACAAR